ARSRTSSVGSKRAKCRSTNRSISTNAARSCATIARRGSTRRRPGSRRSSPGLTGRPWAPNRSAPGRGRGLMGLVLADDILARGFERIRREIDAAFNTVLAVPEDARARLVEAMRYAAIGGGKRVRPLLLTATAEMYGVARDVAVRAGCAVEAIHVYSLIHDDRSEERRVGKAW